MAGRQKNPTPVAPLVNGHDDPSAPGSGAPDIEVIEEAGGTSTGAPAAGGVQDEGVASLQEQLEAERRRAAALEQERDRLAAERAKDQQSITDSRLLVIDGTIKTKESEKAGIMQRLRDAKEGGDYDAEVKAQDELSQINIDLRQAKLGKDRLEHEIEEAKAAPVPQTEDERMEAWFEQNKVGHPSRRWLREHRDYLTDAVKNAELTRAHHIAVRGGHQPNSDGYFEAIETELGLREAEGLAPPPPPQPERQVAERQLAPPAAPVSRGVGMGSGGKEVYPGIMQTGQGKYTILNNEAGRQVREAAEMSGVTVAEYIREAIKLQRGPDGQLH